MGTRIRDGSGLTAPIQLLHEGRIVHHEILLNQQLLILFEQEDLLMMYVVLLLLYVELLCKEVNNGWVVRVNGGSRNPPGAPPPPPWYTGFTGTIWKPPAAPSEEPDVSTASAGLTRSGAPVIDRSRPVACPARLPAGSGRFIVKREQGQHQQTALAKARQ